MANGERRACLYRFSKEESGLNINVVKVESLSVGCSAISSNSRMATMEMLQATASSLSSMWGLFIWRNQI